MAYESKMFTNKILQTGNNIVVSPEQGKHGIATKINLCNTNETDLQKISMGIIPKGKLLQASMVQDGIATGGTPTSGLATATSRILYFEPTEFADNFTSNSIADGWTNFHPIEKRTVAGSVYLPTKEINTLKGGNENKKLCAIVVKVAITRTSVSLTDENLYCLLRSNNTTNQSSSYYSTKQILKTAVSSNKRYYHFIFTYGENMPLDSSHREKAQYVQLYSTTSTSYPYYLDKVSVGCFYYEDLLWESPIYDISKVRKLSSFEFSEETIDLSYLDNNSIQGGSYTLGAKVKFSTSHDKGETWSDWNTNLSSVLTDNNCEGVHMKFAYFPAMVALADPDLKSEEPTKVNIASGSGKNVPFVVADFNTPTNWYCKPKTLKLYADNLYADGMILKDMEIKSNESMSIESSLLIDDEHELQINVKGETFDPVRSSISANIQGVE